MNQCMAESENRRKKVERVQILSIGIFTFDKMFICFFKFQKSLSLNYRWLIQMNRLVREVLKFSRQANIGKDHQIVFKILVVIGVFRGQCEQMDFKLST